MKHEPGIAVIHWQSRRTRRATGGVSPWTVLSVSGILIGLGLTGAQAAGWLRWSGPMALAPAALVLFALAGQMVAVARAMLAWLRG